VSSLNLFLFRSQSKVIMLQDANILVYWSVNWTLLQKTRKHLQKLLEPVTPLQCCTLSFRPRKELVTVWPQQRKESHFPLVSLIGVLSDEVGNTIQQVVLEEYTLMYCKLQDTFSRHCLLEQGSRVPHLLEAELVRRMEHTALVRRLG